jgi:hypothetical protein
LLIAIECRIGAALGIATLAVACSGSVAPRSDSTSSPSARDGAASGAPGTSTPSTDAQGAAEVPSFTTTTADSGAGDAEPGTGVDSMPSLQGADASDSTPATTTGGLTSKDFVCSWVLGIHTTYEWFSAGFEKVVDDARWQVSGIEMAQFGWADPNSNLWNSPITSPCTTGSKAPDRIVFNGVDGSTTVAQFLPEYLSVVNIIKKRFPTVKRIDLTTNARAPGDKECIGANRSGSSWIRPAQDDAIAMIVQMFPGFVFATPKWEVQSCSDFGLCPHISAAANAVLAKTIGEYFLVN